MSDPIAELISVAYEYQEALIALRSATCKTCGTRLRSKRGLRKDVYEKQRNLEAAARHLPIRTR